MSGNISNSYSSSIRNPVKTIYVGGSSTSGGGGGGTNYWTLSGNNIYNNNTGSVGINTSTPDLSYNLDVSGSVRIRGDLLIDGSSTIIDTNILKVEDPLIHLGINNPADLKAGGFYVEYRDASNNKDYTGMVRPPKGTGYVLLNNSSIEPSDSYPDISTLPTSGLSVERLGVNKPLSSLSSFYVDISGLTRIWTNRVLIGSNAGNTGQDSNAIAIGNNAGNSNQGLNSIAIGSNAAYYLQNPNAIAVGRSAGAIAQGYNTVAMGYMAGEASQNTGALSLGFQAGRTFQGTNSIAIGVNAGEINQGCNSIAIGNQAGQNNQCNNTIVLNASGSNLSTTNINGFFIDPIRNVINDKAVYYNTTTKEITYSDISSSGGSSLPQANFYGEYILYNGTNWFVDGSKNVAIGYNSGRFNQDISTVAIGFESGYTGQGSNAVAIGNQAGNSLQGSNSIAIGLQAGKNSQGVSSIAIGEGAGFNLQGNNAVAIGNGSGNIQGNNAVAIGQNAGGGSQKNDAVAVGWGAGNQFQGSSSVAIGSASAAFNQDSNAVAIGKTAGNAYQGSSAIAIGFEAGQSGQNYSAVSIGRDAGFCNQGQYAVAIGHNAGLTLQQDNAIAIGSNAGSSLQGCNAIAIGGAAGQNTQQNYAIALGYFSGNNRQGGNSVAIGIFSGSEYQQDDSVAIGNQAGYYTQGEKSVSIGYFAGRNSQGASSIAIGFNAGQIDQSGDAVSIGTNAGYRNQGSQSVAIGIQTGVEGQRQNAVAIGSLTGTTNQGTNAIAIGHLTGRGTQGSNAIAIGKYAGDISQNSSSVAIGSEAGYIFQGTTSIAIGNSAGRDTQKENSVAIGNQAGFTNQGTNSIAIGYLSGYENQSSNSIAIGLNAGNFNQKSAAVAIGHTAGQSNQGGLCVAIGNTAGQSNQIDGSVAIGHEAGKWDQKANCVAIGRGAGSNLQGTNAIAIGYLSGWNAQGERSIVINATGSVLNNTIPDSCVIAPIRNASQTNYIGYNTGTKELTYFDTISNVNITDISAIGATTYYPTFVDGSGNKPLYINSTNTLSYRNQNFGIGTNTPSTTLDVSGDMQTNGNMIMTGSASTRQSIIMNPGGQAASLVIARQGVFINNVKDYIAPYTNNNAGGGCQLSFGTGDMTFSNFPDSSFNNPISLTERMRITKTGNVGIGTTNPSSKLTVNSNDSNAAISINRYNKDGPAYLYFGATDGSEGAPLPVTAGRTIGYTEYRAYDGTKFIGSVASVAANVDSGTTVGTANMPGNLRFYTRPPNDVSDTNAALQTFERMRITSGGNVGIATKTPSATLDVSGTANITGNLSVDTNTLFVDASNNFVGIGKTNPQTTLDVSGNLMVSRGVLGQNAPLFVDVSNNRVGIAMRAQNPQAPLHVQSDNINSTQVIISGGGSHAHTNRGLRIATYQVSSGDDAVNLDAQFQSGELTFSTAGNRRMTVRNNGNVGIGINAPDYPLDVSGTGRIRSGNMLMNGTFDGMLMNPGTGAGSLAITRSGNFINNVQQINAPYTDNIGSTSGGGAQISLLKDEMTFSTYPTTATAGTPITLTERMRLTATGLGINTTAPSYKLQVEGSGTGNEIVGWFNNQGAFSSSIAVRQAAKTAYITNHSGLGTPNYDGQLSNAISFGVSSGASPIQFWNGNTGVGLRGTAKMTILENGNTGIGTNAPANKLDVRGITRITNDDGQSMFYVNWGSSTGNTATIMNSLVNGGGGYGELQSRGFIQTFYTGVAAVTPPTPPPPNLIAERMRITDTGNVGIGTTSPSFQLELSSNSAGKPTSNTWSISSDQRVKTNIENADLDRCNEIVKNLSLKRFQWSEKYFPTVDDRNSIGFIAQEVEQYFPNAVKTHKNKFLLQKGETEEENIYEEIEDFKSLDIDQLIKCLFGSVKYLQNQVKTLVQKNETLEQRIAKLE